MSRNKQEQIEIEIAALKELHGASSDYEEDHMLPLELGGHPTDPANLWPQSWDGENGAHAKDKLENKLH